MLYGRSFEGPPAGQFSQEDLAALFDGDNEKDVLKLVSDLWDNVRNALSHSSTTFAQLQRNATRDIGCLEAVVISMIHGVVTAWRLEEFSSTSS